ncbi:MAG: SpoIID/LytB domain-containing protein [Candidatus Omnitrophica bacterium]|nr:SpoIID/LytB domain-containing protein [Candidatus Omnitrophota bacterium]
MKRTLLALIFLFSAVSCFSAEPKYIRVLIIRDAESLRIKIKGSYEVKDARGEKTLLRAKNLNSLVSSYGGGILIGKDKFNAYKVTLKSSDPDEVAINGRAYRGDVQFRIDTNGKLLVINRVELEPYVKGILYHEVSHYWPVEALKAQAIVCRTYALYSSGENKHRDFDVTSDIYSQVYGGSSSERHRTNRAVDATRGEVLTLKDKVIPAYFHATCAGRTEDASLLWNVDLPCLKGVACGFCKDSPHFRWHNVLPLSEVKSKLNASGLRVGEIKDILVIDRNGSGRVKELLVSSVLGDIKVPAKDFRHLIGPNIIRSNNFSVIVLKDHAVFEGLGWGHGAGLCQWGAYFMAKQGYSAEQILKHYYPQTDVKTFRF